MAKLIEGVSFNKVAEEFSEDKAKQGMLFLDAHHRCFALSMGYLLTRGLYRRIAGGQDQGLAATGI